MATAYDKNVYIPLSPIIGEVVGRGQNGDDLYQLPAASIKILNDTLWNIVKKIQGNLTLADLTDLAVKSLTATTVITQNLYAEYGDITELTTDRLLTANKVERYWDSDTDDINYISIQGQYIKFITGSTDGPTTQHTDRNGNPLYYNEAVTAETYKVVGMSTTETAYPVTVYDYTEQTKMELSFVLSGEYYDVDWVLGAGSGTGDYGKVRFHKDTAGINLTYYNASTGAERTLRLDDDYIAVVGNIGTGLNVRNIAITDDDISDDAQTGDLQIKPTDYSRYDRQNVTSSTTVAISDAEFIEITGTTSGQTLTITAPSATAGVCIKIIKNSSNQTWTIGATVDGSANPTMAAGESLILLWNNTDWRAVGGGGGGAVDSVNGATGVITLDGGDILLTGYTISSAAAAVAATDTVNEAFGKLQKTVDGIETLLAGI